MGLSNILPATESDQSLRYLRKKSKCWVLWTILLKLAHDSWQAKWRLLLSGECREYKFYLHKESPKDYLGKLRPPNSLWRSVLKIQTFQLSLSSQMKPNLHKMESSTFTFSIWVYRKIHKQFFHHITTSVSRSTSGSILLAIGGHVLRRGTNSSCKTCLISWITHWDVAFTNDGVLAHFNKVARGYLDQSFLVEVDKSHSLHAHLI